MGCSQCGIDRDKADKAFKEVKRLKRWLSKVEMALVDSNAASETLKGFADAYKCMVRAEYNDSCATVSRLQKEVVGDLELAFKYRDRGIQLEQLRLERDKAFQLINDQKAETEKFRQTCAAEKNQAIRKQVAAETARNVADLVKSEAVAIAHQAGEKIKSLEAILSK